MSWVLQALMHQHASSECQCFPSLCVYENKVYCSKSLGGFHGDLTLYVLNFLEGTENISVLETKAGPSVRDRQLLVRTRNFLHISLQINV